RLSGGDDANAFDELLRRDILEQEAARAGAQRLVDVLVEIERRQDEYAALDTAEEDPARRFDSVHSRHANAHQHDMRQQALGQPDRVAAFSGFPDDLDVVFGIQDHAKAVTDERLVVAEKDAGRHRSREATGSRAATRKPPTGARPVSTSPPNAAARS